MRVIGVLLTAGLVLVSSFANAGDTVKFRKHVINSESRYEAAGILDVNRDGKQDIFCGGFWYEAPDWKKHFVRDLPDVNGYYNDFANVPVDVDGDGWTDIVSVAWFSKAICWIRNPGKLDGKFEVINVGQPGNMETALAGDINGDGRVDIFCAAVRSPTWYEFKPDTSAPSGAAWTEHVLPKEAKGHGHGIGDVNNDGLCDIVAPGGWLEQTKDAGQKWKWHTDMAVGKSSIPILVHDVDGDGDSDITWGKAHDYGVYWFEQKKDADGKVVWNKHEIDRSWSQAHFLLFADLDNDGQDELVTGKRVRAHNGKDPGGKEKPCVYWYDFNRKERKWSRHVIAEGGNEGFGIYTMAEDIDGDGDVDVVAPGKSGLYLFENLLKGGK